MVYPRFYEEMKITWARKPGSWPSKEKTKRDRKGDGILHARRSSEVGLTKKNPKDRTICRSNSPG